MIQTRQILEAEVPCELGDETLMDTSQHPPVITHLHVVFTGWLGDDLVECFPVYLVTASLAAKLEEAGLIGISFQDVEVSLGEDWALLNPGVTLPEFRWMQVIGVDESSDFCLNSDHKLSVSERGMMVRADFRLDQASVEDAN